MTEMLIKLMLILQMKVPLRNGGEQTIKLWWDIFRYWINKKFKPELQSFCYGTPYKICNVVNEYKFFNALKDDIFRT